jgi:DNA-binding NarL/FixJ family response regulator
MVREGSKMARKGKGLRVLLADDHQTLRQGLKALLELQGLQVVGEASDGRAAVDAARKLRPDVAVLDVAMPVLNGVEAAREITSASPRTVVILLTALADARFALDALRAGVRGFVDKSQGADELLRAIREVWEGGMSLGPGASQAVIDAFMASEVQPADRLTPREQQVVRLVAEGKASRGIAGELGISVKTAEFHRARIMEKLNIHTTAGLVRYAIRNGLIQS